MAKSHLGFGFGEWQGYNKTSMFVSRLIIICDSFVNVQLELLNFDIPRYYSTMMCGSGGSGGSFNRPTRRHSKLDSPSNILNCPGVRSFTKGLQYHIQNLGRKHATAVAARSPGSGRLELWSGTLENHQDETLSLVLQFRRWGHR